MNEKNHTIFVKHDMLYWLSNLTVTLYLIYHGFEVTGSNSLDQAVNFPEDLQCFDMVLFCFQTPTHVCLITDFCPGGELFALLDKQPLKMFKEDSARYFLNSTKLNRK